MMIKYHLIAVHTFMEIRKEHAVSVKTPPTPHHGPCLHRVAGPEPHNILKPSKFFAHPTYPNCLINAHLETSSFDANKRYKNKPQYEEYL